MALISKIGIIGANHVGAHVANALLYQGLVTELFISDTNEVLCKA
ncbi:MAG: L-lactate dehydrogenase, partial [Atopobium sp.]|nr:L-lactate dehydrogenase [Atopobium sp.]